VTAEVRAADEPLLVLELRGLHGADGSGCHGLSRSGGRLGLALGEVDVVLGRPVVARRVPDGATGGLLVEWPAP
jgi:hypothetical protein